MRWSFGERVSIASATPTDESAEVIKAAQGDRLYAMNPAMQGARANAAASEAIKTAAGNEAGAMTGFMGVGMMFYAIHGGEDKKGMPNPMDEEQFIEDFNEMYND